MTLTALALNCTLKTKRAEDPSSTDRMLKLLAAAMEPLGVATEFLQLADYDIKPGVTSDEGNGDAWPDIRRRILDADILVMGTPIWMGQPSSVCKRALERMDAFLEEKDDEGRMVSYGRVAAVAVVGNEDGAHHVSAELFHHSRQRGDLLGRRSDGFGQFRRSDGNPRGRAVHARSRRPQHGACCPPLQGAALSW